MNWKGKTVRIAKVLAEDEFYPVREDFEGKLAKVELVNKDCGDWQEGVLLEMLEGIHKETPVHFFRVILEPVKQRRRKKASASAIRRKTYKPAKEKEVESVVKLPPRKPVKGEHVHNYLGYTDEDFEKLIGELIDLWNAKDTFTEVLDAMFPNMPDEQKILVYAFGVLMQIHERQKYKVESFEQFLRSMLGD